VALGAGAAATALFPRAIFEAAAVALLATYAAVLFPPRWLVKKR